MCSFVVSYVYMFACCFFFFFKPKAGIGVGNRYRGLNRLLSRLTAPRGSGPFPPGLFDGEGEWLRSRGFEFGTTTGRPRRVGWYDAPVTRYAARINGITDLVPTKLDILTDRKSVV